MRQIKYLMQVLHMKLFHTRTYVLMVLQAYIMYIYMKPVVGYSKAVQYKAAPWSFPFIISNIYFLFLFMLGILYYFSDVPFMQYPNMYRVIRTGRRRWALGQIGAVMLQSFLIMVYNFLISVLCLKGCCEFNLEWGKLLHTAALTNAADGYGFLFSVTYDTLNNYSPVRLTILTIVIGSLVVCFMGLLMFAVSLLFNRELAITVSAVMVVMIYLVENVHPLSAKRMSMFIPVDWMRTANIGVKVHDSYIMPSVGYIFAALVTGILVLCCLILWKINDVEFQWNKED